MTPLFLVAALVSIVDAVNLKNDAETHDDDTAVATEISADAKQLLRTESLQRPRPAAHHVRPSSSRHVSGKSPLTSGKIAPTHKKSVAAPAELARAPTGATSASIKSAPARAQTRSTPIATSAKDAGQKIAKIELYYETRCPDCIEFLNMSLAPLWRNKELRAHYQISMNPYGNAQSVPLSEISQGYKFWHPSATGEGFEMVHICQHGTDECFGNLVQACAIKFETQEKHMELAFCMAAHPEYGIEKSSYECMQSIGIDTKKNQECVFGARGNHILTEFGNLTRSVKGRLGTPWVMINGENLKNPMRLTESVCTFVGPNSLSTCKPFQEVEKPAASKGESEEHHEDDFQVFGKLDSVDKNLVILPPPEHV